MTPFKGSFSGVPIHVSNHLPCRKVWKQVRFPKSKRKRIRKKWAKDKRRNWRSVEAEPVVMEVNGQFYCNKLGYAEIMRAVKRGDDGLQHPNR